MAAFAWPNMVKDTHRYQVFQLILDAVFGDSNSLRKLFASQSWLISQKSNDFFLGSGSSIRINRGTNMFGVGVKCNYGHLFTNKVRKSNEIADSVWFSDFALAS